MRYFLIDKVTELVVGERVRGIKSITLSDEILHDHFPDYPVMPGALILESASQLAGFLLEMTCNRAEGPLRRAVLAQVRKAKFHNTAGPGDQLRVCVEIDSLHDAAAEVAAEVHGADGVLVMRATLTFVLREIDSERVHAQRRTLYRLWTRELAGVPPIL